MNTAKRKPKPSSDVSILEAINDTRLIGDSLSAAQQAALRALYGLPLSSEQGRIFQRTTERQLYEPREYREATYICGRRSGKSSKLAANIAVYEALFRDHVLSRGERGYVVAIAPTKKQASVVFDYILARLEGSHTLRRMIQNEPRADEVDLTNGVTIAVWPCNFRNVAAFRLSVPSAMKSRFGATI